MILLKVRLTIFMRRLRLAAAHILRGRRDRPRCRGTGCGRSIARSRSRQMYSTSSLTWGSARESSPRTIQASHVRVYCRCSLRCTIGDRRARPNGAPVERAMASGDQTPAAASRGSGRAIVGSGKKSSAAQSRASARCQATCASSPWRSVICGTKPSRSRAAVISASARDCSPGREGACRTSARWPMISSSSAIT